MQYSNGVKRISFWLLTFLSIATLLLIGVINTRSGHTNANAVVCADGMGILVGGSTALDATITSDQPIPISLHTTSPYSGQISKVIFYLNGSTPIGRGSLEGNYAWSMPWVAGLSGFTNGQTASLSAKVFFTNVDTGSADSCYAPNPVNVRIYSPNVATLNLAIEPTQWAGPMSASVPINTQATVTAPGFDPTPYALYEWGTTIGFLQPNGRMAQFSSGSAAGTGTIKVKIMYGGATKEVTIPVVVRSPDAPLPTPETNQTTTNIPKPGTTPTNTPKTETTIPAPLQTVQNPTAQSCIASAIGADRFKAINTGTARPTPEELEKFKICFATSNYVVPSNFAPVPPASIKELPVVKTIQIKSLENEKRITDNVEKNVLRFGGKAAPNSIVFIYVFSDPLVLTTTTDGNGNWEYVLEDPIEPGNHEVYSVVNRGNGSYERSEVLSFTLSETAEAATINPNGLTLKLANATPAETQRSLGLYIMGSVTVLALAIAGFILTLAKRNRTSTNKVTFSAFPAESPVISSNPQPEQPTVTYSPQSNSQNDQSIVETQTNNPVDNSSDETIR